MLTSHQRTSFQQPMEVIATSSQNGLVKMGAQTQLVNWYTYNAVPTPKVQGIIGKRV